MKHIITILSVPLMLACATGRSKNDSIASADTSCSVPASSFEIFFYEEPAGTCGGFPSQLVDVDPVNGMTFQSSIVCETSVAYTNDCSVRNHRCNLNVNGNSCWLDVELDFSGGTVDGWQTLSCYNSDSGKSCLSTYSINTIQ